jgi:hypothetical protein
MHQAALVTRALCTFKPVEVLMVSLSITEIGMSHIFGKPIIRGLGSLPVGLQA